jgi:hypothetical protein
MAETVKTLVLQALETMLAEVEGIGSVRLEEEIPFDLDLIPEAERPALFVWDDSDDHQGGNRIARQDLQIMMALFLPLPAGGFPEFSREAEAIAARIHAKMAAPASLRAAGVIQITPGACRKAKATETWGEMTIPCKIDYGHAVGNPFTTQIT